MPKKAEKPAEVTSSLDALVGALGISAAVFEECNDGFKLLAANPKYLKAFGREFMPLDQPYPDVADFFAPTASPHIYSGLLWALCYGREADVTVPIEANQETRWWRYTFAPLVNDDQTSRCRVLCTGIDVTRKYSARLASEMVRTNLESFVKSSFEGIIACRKDGTIMRFNKAAEKIFGYSNNEIVGQSINMLMPSKFAASHDKHLASFARSPDGAKKMGERLPLAGRRKDGSEFVTEVAISKTQVGDDVMFMAVVRDDTDRRAAVDKLRKEANTDFLTGLHNRRSFDRHLEHEVARANRYSRPLSFLALDIDDFKQVNDTHGHDAGDQVLRAIANILSAQSRDQDICARTGGEELCILMPETTLKAATAIAERLCGLIAACDVIPDNPVTVSIGCAHLTDDDTGLTLAARADEKLYEAKAAGKNRAIS